MNRSNGYVTSSGVGAANIWRRYWPLDFLAIVVLALALIFGWVLVQRASQARHLAHVLSVQSERQRQAICAILANIPGHIPPEIAAARAVFARPGHPRDCQPIVHPTPSGTPSAPPTFVIVEPPATAGATASPSRTASPRPTPTHTPSPRPSPSPTCTLPGLLTDPTSCLHL